jgi:hypothetical protein
LGSSLAPLQIGIWNALAESICGTDVELGLIAEVSETDRGVAGRCLFFESSGLPKLGPTE